MSELKWNMRGFDQVLLEFDSDNKWLGIPGNVRHTNNSPLFKNTFSPFLEKLEGYNIDGKHKESI